MANPPQAVLLCQEEQILVGPSCVPGLEQPPFKLKEEDRRFFQGNGVVLGTSYLEQTMTEHQMDVAV